MGRVDSRGWLHATSSYSKNLELSKVKAAAWWVAIYLFIKEFDCTKEMEEEIVERRRRLLQSPTHSFCWILLGMLSAITDYVYICTHKELHWWCSMNCLTVTMLDEICNSRARSLISLCFHPKSGNLMIIDFKNFKEKLIKQETWIIMFFLLRITKQEHFAGRKIVAGRKLIKQDTLFFTTRCWTPEECWTPFWWIKHFHRRNDVSKLSDHYDACQYSHFSRYSYKVLYSVFSSRSISFMEVI